MKAGDGKWPRKNGEPPGLLPRARPLTKRMLFLDGTRVTSSGQVGAASSAAPGGIRTRIVRSVKTALYPVELRARLDHDRAYRVTKTWLNRDGADIVDTCAASSCGMTGVRTGTPFWGSKFSHRFGFRRRRVVRTRRSWSGLCLDRARSACRVRWCRRV